MPQKQQKQQNRTQNKSLKSKDNKKNEKKTSNTNRLSPQQLQLLQILRIKQFFNSEFQKINRNTQISQVDEIIAQDIIKGNIEVSEQSKNVSSLIKDPQQQAALKVTQQQMEAYEKQARRIQHLKLIANLNKQLVNKQPEQEIPYILTKQEHQRKVRQIIQQRKRRQKRMEQIKQSQKQKMQKQEKQAEQKMKKQKSLQKQKRRIQIQEKITKQKQQHIHFLSSDIKHRRDLEQVIKKVPLHIKMEQNFRVSIQIPQLQQKKQEYKQIREFKQKYSVDQIKQHEKEFNQKHKEKLQQSKMKRITSLSSISENFSKLPQKPQRLKSLLAEQIHKSKRKWSQRELNAEQKLKREQNYVKKLKQYKPKIDKEKKQQIQRRLQKEKQHLAKIGLNIDRNKVGLQYLGEAKKIAKKIRQQTELQQNLGDLKHQYKSQTLLPSMKRSMSQQSTFNINRNTEFILKMREKKLSKILNSEQEPDKKMERLKIETQKIDEAKERKLGFLKHSFNEIASKQASNLALNSIKAKMNLIELMKKQADAARVLS